MNRAWNSTGDFELACPVRYKVNFSILAWSGDHATIGVKGDCESVRLACILIL